MKQQGPDIASILDGLGITGRNVSLLTIGLNGAAPRDVGNIRAYASLSGPDELPPDLKVQLGIVVAPLDFMSRTNAEQLLSRLRDVHCEQVLLVDTRNNWRPDELRSLGYLEEKSPSIDGRCYRFDPDTFNQPREWNNASDWANPENFRKYRW